MEAPAHPDKTHCIRCGECCLKSSPTLHAVDLPLLHLGAIRREQLYAIRSGELVMDNVRGELRVTDEELIKVRERDTGGCIFYERGEKACAIYASRPCQCSAFACWDPSAFKAAYETPRLTRWDLVQDGVSRGLMESHEERCGYALLEAYVRRVRSEGESAVQKILEILRFDYRLRPFLSERLGTPPAEMELLFGRPLIDTVHMFGLKVTRESDGGFLLTTVGIEDRRPS